MKFQYLKFSIFPDFENVQDFVFRSQKNFKIFSIKQNIFFGVEKKSWVYFPCRKVRSFDLGRFQSDSSSPAWVLRPVPFFVENHEIPL